MFKDKILPVLLAGIWINLSEFFRNEFLLKSEWQAHYQSLGLEFPAEPINGAIWGIWGFLFALAISALSRKFSFRECLLWAWLMGFALMWLVTGNMLVLPLGILIYAIPLSLVEVAVAIWIFKTLQK
ncbi:hypothetical protein [Croceimicrobium sp.]|uniref:hypothetical protein n=1 Tax=Croceimicrobium sp. TaxID=2828340 RepID=UPI003BAC066A